MNTWSVLGLSSDEIRITKAALSSLYNKISSYQPSAPYPSPSTGTGTIPGNTDYNSYTTASLAYSTITEPHRPLFSSSPTDDLSILYLSCIDLVDHFLHALLTEMFSTKNEILYWERYEQSNGWEKVFIQCNNVLYSYLRSFLWKGRTGQYEVGQQPLETLLFYIESLKSDFHELASILSQLARIVGDRLHPISELLLRADLLGRHRRSSKDDDILVRQGLAFIHEEGTTATTSTNTINAATYHNSSIGGVSEIGNDGNNNNNNSRQEVSTIVNNSILSQELTIEEAYCLQESIHDLLASFILSFRHLLKSHQLALWNSIDDIIDEEVDEVNILEDTQKLLWALQKKQQWSLFHPFSLYYEIDSFPLDLTRRYLQRPSSTERYFIRHAVCLIGLSFIGYRYILPFLLDTDLLKSKLQQIIESVSEKVTEHVYEPLEKLGRELFETIRSRDEIVTKSDLALSKEALQRMLRDYYNALQDDKTTSTSAKNLLMDIKEQLRQRLHQNTASLPLLNSGSGSGSVSDVVGTNSLSVTPSSFSSSSSSSSVSNAGSLSMEELALLDALMREYEKELQTPIRGILFGSLASSILIQMQKLKVHTEAAMLKMDQILASNELTIAATAAMPALGLFTVLVYRFRLWLRGPSSSVPQSHCLQLRMILADLERSLEDLKRMVEEVLPKNTSSSSTTTLLMNEKMQNQLCVAEGLYFYHVKRLRDKVQEVLHYAQPKRRSAPVKSLQQAIEGSMKASRSLTFSGIGKPSLRRESSVMIFDNTPSILQYIFYGIHSTSSFCTAFFHLLFGPAAELPVEETALRRSLEEDLNRLEKPFMKSTCRPDSPFKLENDDHFVELYRGVIRKQTVVQHMRSSYVWFAPVK